MGIGGNMSNLIDKYLGEAKYRLIYHGAEGEVVGEPYEIMAKTSVDAFKKAKAQMPKGSKQVNLIVAKRSIGTYDLSRKSLGEGKGMKYAGLAKEVKKKYGKTISWDKLSVLLAQENIHPDDHMPDVEDALNRIGVKIMPTWSTRKTKVGDKPGRNVGNSPKSWGGALVKKHLK